MYSAINQYVIATREEAEQKTESGIITTSNQKSPNYLVVKTNEETKDLQDKKVIPTHAEPLDHQYFSIDYKDIIAVCE